MKDRDLKYKYNKTKVGFGIGMLIPVLIFVIVFFIKGEGQPFLFYLKGLWKFNILVKLLSLCVFPNLPLFLFFIQKKYDWAARGVLMATFIYAFVVLFSKLF